MFKKTIFSLFLGFILTIFFAQYDEWTHTKILSLLQKVAAERLQSRFNCSVQSLHIFLPSLVLTNLCIDSNIEGEWGWKCKRFELSFSWLQLLSQGSMEHYIIIEDFECTTGIKGNTLAIQEYITAMLQKTSFPIPVQIKSIIFKNGRFLVEDKNASTKACMSFNSSSLRVGNHMKTTMAIEDGYCIYKNETIAERIAADINFSTYYKDNKLEANISVAGSFIVPQLVNQGFCYITGNYQNNSGRFSLRNAYNSLVIDPIVYTQDTIRLDAHLPLSYCAHYIVPSLAEYITGGIGHFSLKVQRDQPSKIDGHIIIEDLMVKQSLICERGKIMFTHNDDEWKTRLILSRYNQELKGSGYWNENEKEGELCFKNITQLTAKAFVYWQIKYNDFSLELKTHNGKMEGYCTATIANTVHEQTHTLTSCFSYNDGNIDIQGGFDDTTFACDACVIPECMIRNFVYKDKEDKELITFEYGCKKVHEANAQVSFPFVRSFIKNSYNYDLQGEGTISLNALVEPSLIKANLELHDATVRLAHTYNFIDGFSCKCIYEKENNSLVFHDTSISLHTGVVHCLRAAAYFDDKGLLRFAHAPIVFNHCLCTVKKDLFAIVSGNLFISKTASRSPFFIEGSIIIDKARFKENLFSDIIQKQFLTYTHSLFSPPNIPVQCNLAIVTKSPISIDTGFFKTNAHMNVVMKKTSHEPYLSGSIALHSGLLNFPYRPLYISKGSITFIPEQSFDPMIELYASNKIKKYDVSLQVEGSLMNHHISLDAHPFLSEEQIVGLLLVGSEENSLNNMMPALLAQNLKKFIFSDNQASFFDKYFKPLLGSFNINLVPSFMDQTGRGGLRGAVEISVNDRWRALIQKNFSLTEDTKFELEFLLSDDITLRAIRDERRDIGGEIEMKWKF